MPGWRRAPATGEARRRRARVSRQRQRLAHVGLGDAFVLAIHPGVLQQLFLIDHLLELGGEVGGPSSAAKAKLRMADLLLRQIDRSELYISDEVFFCGTGVQVAAVVEIDGRPVGDGKIGPVAVL